MNLIHATSILVLASSSSGASGAAAAASPPSAAAAASVEKESLASKSVAGMRILRKLASSASAATTATAPGQQLRGRGRRGDDGGGRRRDRDLQGGLAQLFGIVPEVEAAPPPIITEEGEEASCGEKCGDSDLCSSFFASSSLSSAPSVVDLEAACNSGCIPEFVLAYCAACSGDGDGDGEYDNDDPDVDADADADVDADVVITAEQRFGGGFFGSSSSSALMDLACANCKFYECCTTGGDDNDNNEAVVVDDDRYGACEGYLPDAASLDSFLPDAASLLGGLGASWDDLTEGGAAGGGWGDLLDSMPDLEDILDGHLSDFDSLLGGPDYDDGDNNATGTSIASGVSSALGGLASAWVDDLDWDGIEGTLGGLAEDLHSLLDQALVDFGTSFPDFDSSFPVTCNPGTCTVDGLCDDESSGALLDLAKVNFDAVCADDGFFLCAEGLEAMCDNECGEEEEGGGESDTSFLSVPFCSLCSMAQCCRDNRGSSSFEECATKSLPEMDNITDSLQEMSDALKDITGQLSSFIEEVVVGDASVPDFCPEVDGDGACEVEGFCDIFSGRTTNFDVTSIDYERACTDDAFFVCAPEGFKDMCAERCDGEREQQTDIIAAAATTAVERIGPLLHTDDAAFCSLCGIAACCRRKNGDAASFEECALGSVPKKDGNVVVESTPADDESEEDLSGSLIIPVEESEVAPAAEAAPSTSEPIVEAIESPEGSQPEPSAEGIASSEAPQSESEPIVDEVESSEVAPIEDSSESPDNQSPPVAATLQVTETTLDESGSFITKISTGITLASIAALFLLSF